MAECRRLPLEAGSELFVYRSGSRAGYWLPLTPYLEKSGLVVDNAARVYACEDDVDLIGRAGVDPYPGRRELRVVMLRQLRGFEDGALPPNAALVYGEGGSGGADDAITIAPRTSAPAPTMAPHETTAVQLVQDPCRQDFRQASQLLTRQLEVSCLPCCLPGTVPLPAGPSQ